MASGICDSSRYKNRTVVLDEWWSILLGGACYRKSYALVFCSIYCLCLVLQLARCCFVIACCYQRIRVVSCWLLVVAIFIIACSFFRRFITPFDSVYSQLLLRYRTYRRFYHPYHSGSMMTERCGEHVEVRSQS